MESFVNGVRVETTNNRASSIDELTDRALEKILYVSDTADPMVKAQALAFKERIRAVLEHYMLEAVRSYRHNQRARLLVGGKQDIVELLDRFD